MAFLRWSGDGDVLEPPPTGPAAGHHELRPARSTRLATGTLACPACDAPVALGDGSHRPSDPLDCPFCRHTAPARDFLSLALPTRPARVVVRVVRSATS